MNSIPRCCFRLLIVHILGVSLIDNINLYLRHLHIGLSFQMCLLLSLHLFFLLCPEIVDISREQFLVVDMYVLELINFLLGFTFLNSPVLKVVANLYKLCLDI